MTIIANFTSSLKPLLRFSSPGLRRSVGTYGAAAQSQLAGKTVFLTGASSGIGAATALELARAADGDIKLILAARRTERLKEVQERIEAETNDNKLASRAKIECIQLDVSDYKSFKDRKDLAVLQNVDVLVNNAGMVFGMDPVGSVPEQDVYTMFDTNVMGLIGLTQMAVPGMMARESGGDVVNVGSIAGIDAYANASVYCATKAAVHSFTRALREETVTNPAVRILEVMPGAVETEFSLVRFKGDESKAGKVYEGTQPLTAHDIAEIIVFGLTRRKGVVLAESLVFPGHQASAHVIHRK